MSRQGIVSADNPLRAALWSCRWHFLGAGIFSAFINSLYLAPTLYMLQVYDRVLSSGSKTTLSLISLVLILSLASLSGLDWLRSRILVRCSAQLDSELAAPILKKVLEEETLTRIDRVRFVRDFDTLRQTIAGSGALAAFDAPWIPIYIAAAFLLHPALGLLCIVSCVAMVGLAWLNERVSGPLISDANTFAATAYAKQDNASAWAEEIRALGMVDNLVVRQMADRAKMMDRQTDASFAAGDVMGWIKFLRLALQSASLGLAALLAIDGRLSPGAVVGGSFLLMRCLAPVEQIVAAWKGIVSGRNAYTSIGKLLVARGDTSAKTALPRPTGILSIEDLTVLSPQGNRIGVAEVSFSVARGEMIAVTGPSGSGKSSLMRALAGAAVPARGVVRLDGAATKDWPVGEYAKHVGYLPQDFTLFPGTIKDNISRFRIPSPAGTPTIDELTVEAARLVGAHEMILRLPDGYDTVVGLGGIGLSGGQTQRVALARAMFDSPVVLVLDEPDAHLDLEGESALAAALQHLRANGVTILAAAHRGGLTSLADKMLLLNGGRIQAYGSLAGLAAAMRAREEAPSPQIQQELRRA
jgi:ATP-binding cassette subfamily C exporter for protease/lipase